MADYGLNPPLRDEPRPNKCKDKSKTLQRRRSAEDEQMMRKHLEEGDLISAEVQSIYSDGSLSLHTRSLKYGKVQAY